ncbi:hypothetical protein P4S72_14885 [Vibrio sp. PP-XX7]
MAIIGSILFVFSVYILLVQHDTYNRTILGSYEKISLIEAQINLSDEQKANRKAVEQRRIDLAVGDGAALPFFCALMSALGILMSFVGFHHWFKKVYPDEEAIR